ncbi:cystatin-B-like [Carassius auratus]|uniref:Cystatin-B-like n=1 Tax=Carassius auratus TaxID=7957 RepID=A0A6P6MMU4_CARAU|nr:cystatin-B-like [Carassius auratus]
MSEAKAEVGAGEVMTEVEHECGDECGDECGVGAWTKVKPVTLEVIKICIEVKTRIEKIIDDSKTFIPLLYSRFPSQFEKGTNYFVKVLVDHGDGVCVHVKIHQAPICNGGKLRVTGILFDKTFVDPLKPF